MSRYETHDEPTNDEKPQLEEGMRGVGVR